MKSGYIPNEFIENLLNNIDIVTVISSYLPLKKRGDNYLACCPFHEEKTPSFSVNSTKQFYYCFGCSAGGNIISFLMRHEHMQFQETIETLAAQSGFKVPYLGKTKDSLVSPQLSNLYGLLNDVNQYYQQMLWKDPRGEVALKYLENRGLSAETCKNFQLGYSLPGWSNLPRRFNTKLAKQHLIATGMVVKKENGDCYDRYRNRIMFPIYNRQGKIVGFGGRVLQINDSPKYLNSPKTSIFNKSRELYGFFNVLQLKSTLPYIIVVEGYLDVISLVEHGISYVVATLGTATSAHHLQLLSRYTNRIIFCFDGDAAGKKAAWKALETSLSLLTDQVTIKFMFLPEDQDPDSIVRNHGKERFKAELNSAIEISEFLFAQLKRQVDLKTTNGKSTLISLAMPLLAKVPSKTVSLVMMRQLAQIVDISLDHLIKLSNTPYNKKSNKVSTEKTRLRPLPPYLIACALLLQNPTLAQTIMAKFKLNILRNIQGMILNKLLDLLSQNPHLTTGALVEFWRQESDFEYIVRLANWQHHVPQDGIEIELVGAMQRLIEQRLSIEINKLLKESSSRELTSKERYLLQKWIKEIKLNHSVS